MENLRKYINNKNLEVVLSANQGGSFKNLFRIIHNQDNRIFCEYIESFKTRKLTYIEFASYTKKMASFLAKTIKEAKSSYIGILMENSVNWLAIFWALLMIGYKPLLINAKIPAFMNKDVLNMVDCKMIVTDDSFDNYNLNVSKLSLNKTIGIIEEINQEQEYKLDNWENEIALSTTATSLNIKVCVYTGIDFTNQMLNTKYVLQNNKMVKKHYKGSLKQLTFLPFYHIFGLIATYFWFATYGRTFVFINDYSSNTILKTIRKHEVTHVFAVPLLWHTMYKEIMKQINSMDEKTKKKFYKGVELSLKIQKIFPVFGQKIACRLFKEVQDKTFGPSIKFMISGGGYISFDTIKILNAIGYPLYNGYGSTEIGITSVELRNNPKYRIQATIGKPFPSVSYKIEDGVLLVKGNSICSKIISKNEIKNVNHDEWYNTNDLASFDSKNHYYVNGRKDDVFIGSNGEKVNPDTIEKELKFPSINHYSIIGLKNEEKTELALIIELPNDINDIKLKKILSELKENREILANLNYNIENIYYSKEPICNANAIKVSRKALLKLIESKQVKLNNIKDIDISKVKDEEVLSKEVCEEVKKIMATILGKDMGLIDNNSHFIFDLGGSSLDYCTLLMELKKKYGIEFDLKEQSFSNAIDFSNYIIKKNR